MNSSVFLGFLQKNTCGHADLFCLARIGKAAKSASDPAQHFVPFVGLHKWEAERKVGDGPNPNPIPIPIPPHFVLCRDREATRRATARVCQAVTLAAPVIVKSAGSARPPTPPAPAMILHCFVDSKVRQRHLFSQSLSRRPKLRWCQLRTSLLQPHLVPLRR